MTSLYDCGGGGGLSGGSIQVGGAAPTNPQIGSAWLDPTGPTWMIWDGTNWVTVGGGGGGGGGLISLGSIDVTQPYTAPATPPAVGSFGTIQTSGTADATWNPVGITGPQQAGDLLFWDGTQFQLAGGAGAFLPLAGGDMTDTAVVDFTVPAGAAPAAPVVRIDGLDPAKSALERFTFAAGMLALPALAPIGVAATAVVNDVSTITVSGGPADQAYTVTVTYQIDGSGVDMTFTAPVVLHDTADAVANALVAACPAELSAVKTGIGTLDIRLGTATAFDVLFIAII